MAKATKTRLDSLLVSRGLAESRTRAQALIMAGKVFTGTRRLDKPGQSVARDLPLAVRAPDHPWASRGGVKLAHALDQFAIDPTGLVCLDIGASTGGFTDVLLSRGAAQVVAVDVGHGQLHWRLRTDPRVVILDRVNARHLEAVDVPAPPALITCDVSFISLTLALPPAMALAAPGAGLVALIKPQFEVGKGQVGKGGIVRNSALRAAVCGRIRDWLGAQPGWAVTGLVESPITGSQGNIEFLIAARRH